jgi:hypothetical protein
MPSAEGQSLTGDTPVVMVMALSDVADSLRGQRSALTISQ